MSFRAAYNNRFTGNQRRNLTPFRDPTPEQWARKMEEYYKKQAKQKMGIK